MDYSYSAITTLNEKPFGKLSTPSPMKKIPILLLSLLLLAPAINAETYTLGSHQVSFNISINHSVEVLAPTYYPKPNNWMYTLGINFSIPHALMLVGVYETGLSDPNYSFMKDYPDSQIKKRATDGTGGYQYSSTSYHGYPAYMDYYPEQMEPGSFLTHPTYHGLVFEIENGVVVEVFALGGAPFQEVLDTLQVSEAPKKPTKYAPYIGPIEGYAGNGSGAKPGWENQNLLNGRQSP